MYRDFIKPKIPSLAIWPLTWALQAALVSKLLGVGAGCHWALLVLAVDSAVLAAADLTGAVGPGLPALVRLVTETAGEWLGVV